MQQRFSFVFFDVTTSSSLFRWETVNNHGKWKWKVLFFLICVGVACIRYIYELTVCSSIGKSIWLLFLTALPMTCLIMEVFQCGSIIKTFLTALRLIPSDPLSVIIRILIFSPLKLLLELLKILIATLAINQIKKFRKFI